jgi:carboxypeptidase Taq
MTTHDQTFEALCQQLRKAAQLESINSLLNWDERTYMPSQAGEYRAEQIATVTSLTHDCRTDRRIGEWLDSLADHPGLAEPASDVATVIRRARRDYDRHVKLPSRLVEELARQSVTGQQVWVEARKANDFAKLAPSLEAIVRLKREQAACWGYADCPYDALLDEYEPDARTRDVAATMEGLRAELVPLVQEVLGRDRGVPRDLLNRHYPQSVQARFGQEMAAALGFDFQRGRLDITHHPFCTEMGPHDCRITTRYDERFFPSAFFGILHEAGHGMYEQGRRPDQYGLPTGQYVSLGIHESQSRLWENQVGRSRAFWTHAFPLAQHAFPDSLGSVPLDDFVLAINDVRPSLIRVEADEATYNLHILVRFELEQALIHDELKVADLPEAWNAKYKQYLDIEPATNAEGVMQDIHWPAALLGYFPTYTLGNLYAAQFFEAMDREFQGIDRLMARGEFAPILEWLRTHVHQHGQAFTPAQLLQRATGQTLSHAALIRHLRGKLLP